MDLRQTLTWHATKAKKKNLIDSKTFDVIRRLCKEPMSTSSDEKIRLFTQSFLHQLARKDPSFIDSAPSVSAAPPPPSFFELLPQSVLTKEVFKYLTNADWLSLAFTSFGVNTHLFPVEEWVNTVLLLMNSANNVLFQSILVDGTLFPPFATQTTRWETIQRFGRASHLVQVADNPNLVKYEVMLRYLLPRLSRLQLKAVVDTNNRATGDPLVFSHAAAVPSTCEIELVFKNTRVPPVVNVGCRVCVFALESDGRSISQIENASPLICANRFGKFLMLHSAVAQAARAAQDDDDDSDDSDDEEEEEEDAQALQPPRARHVQQARQAQPVVRQAPSVSGKVGFTLCGERSARWLGKMMYGDELHFQVELMASSNAGHGLANQLNTGYRENITMQTPRTTFRVPEGYFEVSSLGLSIKLPLNTLFQHCGPKM